MLRVVFGLLGGMGLACVGFVVFVMFSLGGLGKGGFAFWKDKNALDDNLSYVTLRDFLSDVDNVDALALYDEGPRNGTPQWYLIPDPITAYEAQIGLPPARFLDMLAGRTVTVYCSSHGVSQGKILWALRGGEPAKARVYCARRRMDLSQLIPLALPAQNIDREGLDASAFRDLKAQVEQDSAQAVTFASDLSQYSHTCQMIFPYVWQSQDDIRDWGPRRVEQGVRDRVTGIVGSQNYDLDFAAGFASDYVKYGAEGQDVSQEGWPIETPFFWIAKEGETRKVPGLRLFKPVVTLKADASMCEAFDALDFAPLWQDERDMGLLDIAWERGVDSPHRGGVPPTAEADLRQDIGEQVSTQQITYRLRYLDARVVP